MDAEFEYQVEPFPQHHKKNSEHVLPALAAAMQDRPELPPLGNAKSKNAAELSSSFKITPTTQMILTDTSTLLIHADGAHRPAAKKVSDRKKSQQPRAANGHAG